MSNDILNPIYSTDYVSYDDVYVIHTKIPTKSDDAIDVDITDNTTNYSNCVYSYYQDSKYFLLFMFLAIIVVIGGLFFIIFICTQFH